MPYREGRAHVRNGRLTRESADIKVLRTLGIFSVRRAIDIKVLTDLRVLRGSACYRHAGPDGPEAGFAFRMLRRVSETRRGFDGGAFGKRLWMQRRNLFRSVRT